MLPSLKNSILTKIIALGTVFFVLYLALGSIGSLIDERGLSQQQATAELAATHAGPQTLVGPLLVVPYVEKWTADEQRTSTVKTLDKDGVNVAKDVVKTVRVTNTREGIHLVFPQRLDIDGKLAPQERYRGIFTILFYDLQARLTGTLPAFDPASVPHVQSDSSIELGAPMIALSLTDVRGISGAPQLSAAGETLSFGQRIPGAANASWLGQGVHAPLTGAALQAFQKRQPLPFDLRLGLVGQQHLAIAPLADDTTAHLQSSWPHPSFGGRFLATQRTVSKAGFDARWTVSSLVSGARVQVQESTAAGRKSLDTFDITLAQPLNVYALSTRAVKYGALFIGLVLAASFMFEVLRKLRLHPVQYGLVGLSIALFFLLLLALSEKMDFSLAYACAATAGVLLLAVYFSAVLKGWRRGVSLGGFVGVLYAALYGLLVSENNALLLGSLLLFGILALLMIATRRVDWYALGGGRGDNGAPAPPAPPTTPPTVPPSAPPAARAASAAVAVPT
ncbi:cell envelope integrity protein CreD [soil metagenome]